MTELTAENKISQTQQKPEQDFSTITPGLSTEKFLNYQSKLHIQDYDAKRKRGGIYKDHDSIDYGSNAQITLGSEIQAVQGGEATVIRSGWLGDAAVQVKSKDPETGKDVYITYGHLSQASVTELLKNADKDGKLTVQAGDVIGKVGKSGKVGGNEYHVHIDIIDADAVDKYGRQGAKDRGYAQNPLEYFKKAAKAADLSANTSNSNERDTALTGTIDFSNTAFTGTVNSSGTAFIGPIDSSITDTALTGSIDTALRGGYDQQPQQTQQSGMALS